MEKPGLKVERVKFCKQKILILNLELKRGRIIFCKQRSLVIGYRKLNTKIEEKRRRKGKREGLNFQLSKHSEFFSY